ncbi:MAG: FAD-dependent oxidoreductase, partial [Synergistaceae bacterium]|nr:FAD-dependent oxidoreductase [Synergistaceae bacterium]
MNRKGPWGSAPNPARGLSPLDSHPFFPFALRAKGKNSYGGQGDAVPLRGLGRRPKVLLLIFFFFIFFSRAEGALHYDLVVAGGGAGGCAAAIQAGRSGLSVAVVEASDFVGGQISGAAVSTMDDLGRTRTGIYAEFIDRVRARYSALGAATNICLWGGDTIATEPSAARDILTGMTDEAGGVDIYLRARIRRAIMSGDRITGVEIAREGEVNAVLEAGVFIDATEHGDLLPLAGAAYRVGGSTSMNIDPEDNVQDITYAAVVKRYPDGLPENLRMPGPPPGYGRYVKGFRGVVAVSGDRWPGSYPFDVPSHNAYRALPDADNDALIIGDDPDTWQFITRTCLNWANDYPGAGGNRPGLSVMYIEDMEYRKKVEREAMNKTLAFIWYMQSELGMADWSVDDGQGYGGWFSNDWETARDPLLPREFAPILRHFPPFPYVREGRRIMGVETLSQRDISRDVSRGRAYKNYPSSLALGEYPIDVHGSHLDRYMEHGLGESSESFPRTWAGSEGVFQVPFGAFVPERIDGLIAAEKNISVSRMVNGAIRLQPIAMHTGQAAGAIAAEAARSGRLPRDIDVGAAQRALFASGCWIALDQSSDVTRDGPYWSAVQWASLREALPKISRSQFGVT